MAAPQAYPHMEELIASMIETTNHLLNAPPTDIQRLASYLHMSAFALRDLWHTSRQMAELQGAIQVLQASQIVAVMRNEPALSAATDLLVGMNTVGGLGGNGGPMGGMGGWGASINPVAAGSIMLPPPIPAPFVAGHPASAYPPLPRAPPPPLPPSSNQTPQPRRRSKKRRRPLSMVSTAEPTSPQAVVPPSAPKALLLASKATPAASKRRSFQAGHSRAASKAEGEISGTIEGNHDLPSYNLCNAYTASTGAIGGTVFEREIAAWIEA